MEVEADEAVGRVCVYFVSPMSPLVPAAKHWSLIEAYKFVYPTQISSLDGRRLRSHPLLQTIGNMEVEEEFDAIFGSEPNLAYQEQILHDIQKYRRLLENELFFDRLLKAVGIDQGTYS